MILRGLRGFEVRRAEYSEEGGKGFMVLRPGEGYGYGGESTLPFWDD